MHCQAKRPKLATFGRETVPTPMWKATALKILHYLSLWLFWPGIAVIIWGELVPHPPVLGGVLMWDKADHFIAYFGLAAMAVMILDFNRRLLWTLLGLIVMGGVLEFLQGYTGRDPDIFDFVANSVGTIAGAAIGALFLFLLRGRLLVAQARRQ